MKKFIIILLLPFYTFAGNPCAGKTASGEKCSRTVKEGNYCFQHNPSSKRCGAKTKSGGSCKRIVKTTPHCSQHS
jgi:hypothetical protein